MIEKELQVAVEIATHKKADTIMKFAKELAEIKGIDKHKISTILKKKLEELVGNDYVAQVLTSEYKDIHQSKNASTNQSKIT